jgi:acetyl-CoA carboxylase biotin carboxyl carrier protein
VNGEWHKIHYSPLTNALTEINAMAQIKVLSDLNAMVWKIEVAAGQRVAAGDTLIVLEAMKMEIPVTAPRGGTVAAILVAEKQMVAEGEALAVLDG